MKVLVTGASGFIGSYLTDELISHGYDVTAVDFVDGDLRLPRTARELIKKYTPDVVMHLAGLVGRLFGEEDVENTIRSNAIATTYIAKACAAAGIRLIYASTSEAYGDCGEEWAPEELHGKLPYNMYGLSKRWAEEAARLYMPEEKLQIFRLSMPYGPGLPAGHGRAALITFIFNSLHRREITVHRGGMRCWCYVSDSVRGIRMLLEDGGSGVWLIARDDNETTMLEIAKKACVLTGASEKLINEVEPPSNQTVVKRLRPNKLMAIGWRPMIELDEGMRRVHEAVRKYDKEGRPPSVC